MRTVAAKAQCHKETNAKQGNDGEREDGEQEGNMLVLKIKKKHVLKKRG